jgi:hypothetical protein
VQRWLRWISSVASIAYGGPANADPNSADMTLPPADRSAAHWVTTSAVLAPVVVVVLALLSVPWPITGVLAAILLLPVVIHRIRALRGG